MCTGNDRFHRSAELLAHRLGMKDKYFTNFSNDTYGTSSSSNKHPDLFSVCWPGKVDCLQQSVLYFAATNGKVPASQTATEQVAKQATRSTP